MADLAKVKYEYEGSFFVVMANGWRSWKVIPGIHFVI